MTNAEIIFANRVFLMEQEVIKGVPGTNFLWKDEQGERQILMPEEIRTCKDWNRMGYRVRKGEHAIAKFQIWMPKKGKSKTDDEDADEKAKGFYLKMAFFFTIDQVVKEDK